jgi:hypothetical protein
MSKPTEHEIDLEVEKLRKQVKTVRHYSAFGDNNRKQIEAQIRVAEDEFDDEDIEEFIAFEEQTAARDMLYWMQGDEDMAPSESWEPLCKK